MQKNNAAVTQAEIQAGIQRFTSLLHDRLIQAFGEVERTRTGTAEVSDTALRATLVYASSSLEIATGPLPEVNLLDMVVFVRLCREAFETYWMPEVYGDAGRAVSDVFRRSEDDLWQIAERVISSAQRRRLEALIAQWRKENPGQFRVEGVRLMDFARRAGAVEASRAEEASGLLSSVKSATQAADQALLIAERALFLAHRLPFLMRLQARVGSREIIEDVLSRVGSPAQLMTQVQGFEPMVREMPNLAERSGEAAHEARLLVQDLQPFIPSLESAEKINDTITRTNELTVNTREMLREIKESMPRDASNTLAIAKRGIRDTLKKSLVSLALLGGVWSALWWGGYYLVKRRLAQHA